INAETLDAIAKVFKNEHKALAALFAEKRKTSDGVPVSFLEHHLRQYTKRNDLDFFIHKDLKGFLEKELDFYLKNEVLNLDEIGTADETRAEGWFQLMKIAKAVGQKIITFLAQIENFQKKLFEKKKFITETQYCITVKNIPESFYKEISENQAQWDEWKELFHIDENSKDLFTAKDKTQRRIDFIKNNPTLVLDTKHFGEDFTGRLLAGFGNLDEMIDGILINSENFQALNLLKDKYQDKIKSIYIDPPYNTDASSILYKNDYKDSSWLSMVENRLILAYNFLKKEGIICVAIDDEELSGLKAILSQLFEKEIGIVAVRSNPAGRKTTGRLAPAHEYALFFGKSEQAFPGSLLKTEKGLSRYPKKDELGRFAWANFVRSGSNDRREDRPKLFYPIFVSDKNSIRIPKMKWDNQSGGYILLEQPSKAEVAIYPTGMKGGKLIEKNWQRGHERVPNELEEYRVRRTPEGEISIDFKTRMDEDSLPITWWDSNLYASANYGAAELKDLFGEKNFDFAKSRSLVEDCLRTTGLDNAEDFVLDFFAGSGTTAHAIVNLNREDGMRRGFIIAEMARYFDSVILPRIKKVVFTPKWSGGKPERQATTEEANRSPRIIKYLQMESYEDVLNNISFDDAKQGYMKFDNYLLEYMLDFETKGSETFLNIEKLASPFDYKLLIHCEGQTKEKPVDLPETFNYLLGLNVDSRKVYKNGDNKYVVYRGAIDHKKVSVIWRTTKDWKKQDYEQDKKFVVENKLTDGADEIFVNGDSFIPGAKSLDPIFKNRMFAGS
ncbi:MAG: DNA methyltransferase, partial [Phycisphaerae bacterium]